MARITKLDQALLAEAYTAQLFQESAPYMTIAEIQKRLPNMTIEEAQVIEELFGKLGQKLGQVASGIGGVGSAAGKGLAAAGRGVANTVGQAGQAVAQKAQQVGAGVKAAAGQAAQNVGNLYSAAAADKEQAQAIENASKSAMDLIDLVQAAQNKGLINLRGEVTNMSLAQIMSRLEQAKGQTAGQKQSAQDTGFTGGVGSAFKQGMQSTGSKSTGEQQPPPLPAGAQATA
jgi:hypothetical protein